MAILIDALGIRMGDVSKSFEYNGIVNCIAKLQTATKQMYVDMILDGVTL